MRIDRSNKLKLHYVSQNSYNLEAKLSNRNSNINQKMALHNNRSFNKNKCIEAKRLVNVVYTMLNKQNYLNIYCNREDLPQNDGLKFLLGAKFYHQTSLAFLLNISIQQVFMHWMIC